MLAVVAASPLHQEGNPLFCTGICPLQEVWASQYAGLSHCGGACRGSGKLVLRVEVGIKVVFA